MAPQVDDAWIKKETKRLNAVIAKEKEVLSALEGIKPRTPAIKDRIRARENIIKGLQLEKKFVAGILK